MYTILVGDEAIPIAIRAKTLLSQMALVASSLYHDSLAEPTFGRGALFAPPAGLFRRSWPHLPIEVNTG